MFAVISGTRDLKQSNSPLNLHTPCKPNNSEKEGDMNVLPADTIKRLLVLMKEAEDFVQGRRKDEQIDAFDHPPEGLPENNENATEVEESREN